MTTNTSQLRATELAELQTLPAVVLSELPVPTQLNVQLPGGVRATLNVVGELPAQVDNAPIDYAPLQAGVAFHADEVAALACAVEHGRASVSDVIGWVQRKAAEPSFRLDHAAALQGAHAPSKPQWSLGQVLKEIGAVVIGGLIVSATPAALSQAA